MTSCEKYSDIKEQNQGAEEDKFLVYNTKSGQDVPIEGLSRDAYDFDSPNAACYLPQPSDVLPHKDHLEKMGPIGPWATGKVDWSPLAGLTGTRPVVDKYSITRFSPNEWRTKNNQTIQMVENAAEKTLKNHYSTKTSLKRFSALVEKTQQETNKKLSQRVQLINKWKVTLETAIKAMQTEITTMERERIRLKKSLVIFGVPESIAKECIDKRSSRADTELVRDQAEEELVKELALMSELKRLLNKTLEDFEQQQVENRTARQRLEYDWSDKLDSYNIDLINVSLHNNSPTILFCPGAVRQPMEQSSEQYWMNFSKEILEECERCREKSVALRNTLNNILLNAARDIRSQADSVEKALISRINCTQENLRRFENDLRKNLQTLADTETRIAKLHVAVKSFDSALKVAQTRMDNRSFRLNVENCRDLAQQDLINEVATIQSSVTAILDELDEAERCKVELMQVRNKLEREIMLKRRTLYLDRERCMLLRSHYPSANSLSGFSTM